MSSTLNDRNDDRAGKHPQGTRLDEGTSAADHLLAIENLLQRVSLLLLHLARLASAEARLTAASIPQFVSWWMILVPLWLLSWIAFSFLISWCVYLLSNSVFIAAFGFLITQLAACFAVSYRLGKLARRMRFPNTTRQWQSVKETLLDEA